jgi:hypothetical protein
MFDPQPDFFESRDLIVGRRISSELLTSQPVQGFKCVYSKTLSMRCYLLGYFCAQPFRDMTEELPASKLGTKEHWDLVYERETREHKVSQRRNIHFISYGSLT